MFHLNTIHTNYLCIKQYDILIYVSLKQELTKLNLTWNISTKLTFSIDY